MSDEPLTEVAGRIADGELIDSASASVTFSSDYERDVAKELEVIGRIAAGHRDVFERMGGTATRTGPVTQNLDRLRWGELELRDIVGRGSYGTVYRAWDPRLERVVALKLFHRAAFPDRVIKEGRMLARIRHTNVVTVHGAAVIDGVAGIWMELLQGPTLDETIRHHGALPVAQAAAIGADVARALAAIHHANLLHCDVKAQNVVIERDGRTVLTDLGAARVLADSSGDRFPDFVGTPKYMSPELFKPGAPATRASDIYSLGVLLYYMVTGKFPVEGRSLGELHHAHHEGRLTPLDQARPGVAAAYVDLVTRALDPDPAKRPASVDEMLQVLDEIAAPPVATNRVWKVAAAVLSVALIVLALWVRGVLWPPPPRSIAVLPIKNLTGDPSKAYVADGLTEVLISNMARVRSIHVASFNAVAAMRDTTEPYAAVAKKLGVQYLIAGSINQLDEQFRMSVQLIDPRTGDPVWGETITREAPGMLSAQADIARMVADELALSLSREERAGLTQRPIDPKAQEAYLEGLTLTRQSPIRQAEIAERFRRAVEIDPKFAAAWADLALTERTLLEQSASSVDRASRVATVKEMALTALRLDPTLGDGYVALGTVQFYHERDFPAAEHTLLRAMEVDQSNAFARQRYSMLLAAEDRMAAALEVGHEAEKLEPLIPDHAASQGMLYYYARDYPHAIAQMERALQLSPGFARAYYGLGRIRSAQGDHDGALRDFGQALSLARNATWIAETIRAYTAAGRAADAAGLKAELAERERRGESYGYDHLAFLAAAEGRTDDAFRILNEAVDRGMVNILWIKVDPRADPLRADARFPALVARIGLDR